MNLDSSEPLEHIQCRVRQCDYDLVFKQLGDDRRGLRQDVMSNLFHSFAAYIRTLEITPYPQNKNAPTRIRNLSAIVSIGAGTSDDSIPRRPSH